MTVTVEQPRAIGARVPVPTESPWTLDVLGPPAFAIVAYGIPAPQGSKDTFAHRHTGKRIVKESNAPAVKAWRTAVGLAARVALPRGWEPLDGPLIADMVFSMPRFASTPKTLRTLPDTKPDLDKLARCTGDGIGTTVKVIEEDSRIVGYRRLCEVFERDALDPDALRQPGAVIRLWRVPAHLLGKVTP